MHYDPVLQPNDGGLDMSESREAVALELLRAIGAVEGRAIINERGAVDWRQDRTDEAWVLDTYVRCLNAAGGVQPVIA
jgi:hypothetical protein